MVKAAAACPVQSGVSGEGPRGRLKVPEGIHEAWRVASDLPPDPWPLVVSLEVCSVQLRAHYAVGVSSYDMAGILVHQRAEDVFHS